MGDDLDEPGRGRVPHRFDERLEVGREAVGEPDQSVRVARVRIAWTSEPAFGSVIE